MRGSRRPRRRKSSRSPTRCPAAREPQSAGHRFQDVVCRQVGALGLDHERPAIVFACGSAATASPSPSRTACPRSPTPRPGAPIARSPSTPSPSSSSPWAAGPRPPSWPAPRSSSGAANRGWVCASRCSSQRRRRASRLPPDGLSGSCSRKNVSRCFGRPPRLARLHLLVTRCVSACPPHRAGRPRWVR